MLLESLCLKESHLLSFVTLAFNLYVSKQYVDFSIEYKKIRFVHNISCFSNPLSLGSVDKKRLAKKM